MDVKTPDGKVETWMVEGGTPNTLQRRGITRDSIKIGTVIVVAGFKAKDGRLRANGRDITLPRRPHAVHGIVGHRRAERRPRPDAETKEAGTLMPVRPAVVTPAAPRRGWRPPSPRRRCCRRARQRRRQALPGAAHCLTARPT